jgi:protein SCO1/2
MAAAHLTTSRRPPTFACRRAALAVGIGLLGGLAGCDRPGGMPASRAAFKAVDITGAEYARKLELTGVDGQARSLADFKGKVTVVFFGFTQCPDVCPTTMAELAEVKRLLGPDGARVAGVFVTVDPERDTPELLKDYVANFGPDMVGLRGTPEQTRATAKEFKVFYSKVPGKTDTSYTIDHTAGSYVFDTQGRIRLFTRHGTGAQALADDLKLLLAEAG